MAGELRPARADRGPRRAPRGRDRPPRRHGGRGDAARWRRAEGGSEARRRRARALPPRRPPLRRPPRGPALRLRRPAGVPRRSAPRAATARARPGAAPRGAAAPAGAPDRPGGRLRAGAATRAGRARGCAVDGVGRAGAVDDGARRGRYLAASASSDRRCSVPRGGHLEFLSDDPGQTVKFFQDAFGWKSQAWEGQTYWLVDTGEGELGINGGVMRTSDFPHTQNALCTVDVEDIGDALAKVEAAGGKVIVPERQVGEAGWAGDAADPQGVVFGVGKSA